MLTFIELVLSGLSAIALFLFFIIYSWHFFTTLKAPFVPISKNVLPKIIDVLDVDDNSVVYDLGCGDARVLVRCYKYNQKAKYIGIEKSIVPRILAWFKLRKIGNPKNIRIINGNFFKKDISQATRVFLYLLPGMMDSLLPKLEKELKQGTSLVSYNFTFSKKQPAEVIDLSKLGKIYKYKF